MVHAFPTASPRLCPHLKWRRPRQRGWVRPNDLPSAAVLFAAIPSLPRATLSRLTTHMIDRMDEIDGDPELEMNGDELDGSLAEDDFHRQDADRWGYVGDHFDAEHSAQQEQAYE